MDPAHQKAIGIFRELAGERAEQLLIPFPKAKSAAHEALSSTFSPERAREIAFHLADWNSDAAFITALMLFPERFTPEEITTGIESFLVHAPNHIAAAAKLHGWPIDDIFDVGALDGPDSEDPTEVV